MLRVIIVLPRDGLDLLMIYSYYCLAQMLIVEYSEFLLLRSSLSLIMTFTL